MNKFQIIPYAKVDGVPTFKDSELVKLYDQLVTDGIEPILFHDGTINNAEQFVRMATDPNILFYIIMDTTYGLPSGIFWANRIEQTHCYCHFTCLKPWWGTPHTVQMGKMAMDHLLTLFHTVMGMIPESNIAARDYLHKVGLRDIGKVPNYLWSKQDNGPVDGFVMYITREDLDYDIPEQ